MGYYTERIDDNTVYEYPVELEQSIIWLESEFNLSREHILDKLGVDMKKYIKKEKKLEGYKANF